MGQFFPATDIFNTRTYELITGLLSSVDDKPMVEKVPLVYVLAFIASKTNNKKEGEDFVLFVLVSSFFLVLKIIKNVSQQFSKASYHKL